MPWIPPVTMSAQDQIVMAALLNGLAPSIVITPLLMGVFIDSIFLGIVCTQVLTWWGRSTQETGDTERRWVRVAVVITFITGLAQWVLSVSWTTYLFGFNFGRWTTFHNNKWIAWYPLLNASMVIPVQIFYAQRVYHIAGRLRAVLLLVGVPLLLSLVGAIGVCVAGMTDNTIGTTYNNFGWMWIAGVAAADIVITVVVLTALFNEASKTTFEPTDTIIRRLIKIACESQLPPTIMAIAMLLDFAIQGDSYYVVFFEMIQGKLYVVGMLYVLNKHADMRSQSDRGGMAARVAHTPAARPLTMNHLKQDIGRAAIHVQTETYVESHTINPEFGRRRNIEPKFREPSVSGDTETGSTSGTSLGGPTHTNYDSSTNYDHQNFDIPNQSKVGLTASSPRNEKQF